MDTITPAQFWNERYEKSSPETSGRPGLALAQFASPLTPGHALELGCAKGDDAIWLARQGWHVTAVDISSVVLGYASTNAGRAGMSEQIRFEEHDLAISCPSGAFDLVTASFLHSPQNWPRSAVLSRAAEAVRPGGHILIVGHGSRAPWSSSPEDTRFPSAEDTLTEMGLDVAAWKRLCVCPITRTGHGPDGQTATVTDNIIFLQRLS
ncbi:bifunctional 2-polyprenyl-6-hydroxyphenol methylase/3-demethylubiquinol 3-O-methyltransferase UbiG [Notoacmeibacter sp. MSK16QG-6]|uniref:class I SAM-dependent methyltransferase n=1 Tax=Notoacmeibacter sp. MSK16QG-6 TaxID=2957982 RepID=UPI0020A04CE0|nr:class I SAM-dependent methyltransferase [Notoacmeibacter sp. MSK16QG-6]MCP1199044.1 class I SAM-dependent methyltransferase [Notoacmeibacter sp. MSK16QG-6]